MFQFESEGMREALRQVKPTEFEDLVALNALYRPGAMAQIATYARNKRNPGEINYIDERLRPITEATYGVILYQEQSMQIAKAIAGFSGAEADDLRKAIGKKKREAMAALKERFYEGARATGTTDSVIESLWATNEAAADYSFNRSHAACYGLIGYRTAWLRANYPAEYMAALISSVMSTKDKVPFFVAHCEDMGITVLPPDVNESAHDFTVHTGESGERDTVRFGLDAVKNVGSAAVDKIVEARQADGPFTSVWDFCRRVDCQAVNRRAIEALIKCGALDSTGATRVGHVLGHGAGAGRRRQKAQQDAQVGQGSIFDLGEPEPGAAAGEPDLPVPGAARRARAGQRVGEGDAGPVPVLAPAEGGAARAAPARGLLAGRPDRPQVGRPEGRGGRHGHREQADPHPQGRQHDVRHARRPRGGGRDDRVRQGGRGVRRGHRGRRRAAGARARGAQGRRRHQARARRHQGRTSPRAKELAAAAAMPEPGPELKRLTIEVAGHVPETFLDDLKDLCRNNPGEHELELVVGRRRLILGDGYRVSPSGSCLAELGQLPGTALRQAA